MEAIATLVLVLSILTAFAWASLQWGVDSRDLERYGRR